MPNDRDKLLKVMDSLEEDYASGKISPEKYSYFRSKYEDKLNSIDAREATRRIRSMQGKPSSSPNKEKRRKRPTKKKIWFKSTLLILKRMMQNIIKKKRNPWIAVPLNYYCC